MAPARREPHRDGVKCFANFIPDAPSGATVRDAGVAQWQSRSFPSLRRGFDSLHPLHAILPCPSDYSRNAAPSAGSKAGYPRDFPGGAMPNPLVYLGVGALAMYLMDPQSGRKRRNDLRNQLDAGVRKLEHGRDV